MEKKIDLTLPEFVFLDGNEPKGNTLEGRTVMQHIRSYTVMEVLLRDELKELNLNCQTYDFTYKNKFGVIENHVFAVHFTLAELKDMQEIFERCAKWYCHYLAWEDNNITTDETAKFN